MCCRLSQHAETDHSPRQHAKQRKTPKGVSKHHKMFSTGPKGSKVAHTEREGARGNPEEVRSLQGSESCGLTDHPLYQGSLWLPHPAGHGRQLSQHTSFLGRMKCLTFSPALDRLPAFPSSRSASYPGYHLPQPSNAPCPAWLQAAAGAAQLQPRPTTTRL